MRKPVLGTVPPRSRIPEPPNQPSRRQFAFSLRYLRQEAYFGLGSARSSWFVELLGRMTELSSIDYDSLMSDFRAKQQWRLHEINWSAKNIPVKRADLSWIDSRYLDNEEEYPFFQFQISTAHGRVIGFWDERGIFNIVFLDISHNMQPSRFSDYKLRETTIAKGEFALAIDQIELAISSCGDNCGCRSVYGKLQNALTHNLPFETMLIPMSQHLFDQVTDCIASGLAHSVSDLLDMAVASLA